MRWVKAVLFTGVNQRSSRECNRESLLCIKSVHTLVAVFLSARVHSGLNAHVTVLSTTVSAKRRAALRRAEWIALEFLLRTAFSPLTLLQFLQVQQLESTQQVKKLKAHTALEAVTNHVCIN
jgi:hypothetical protein